MKDQLAALKAVPPPDGGSGKKWQMSRPKDLEASIFTGKDEEWPKWKEQMQDYVDAIHAGLKQCLVVAGNAKAEITETTFKAAGRRKPSSTPF